MAFLGFTTFCDDTRRKGEGKFVPLWRRQRGCRPCQIWESWRKPWVPGTGKKTNVKRIEKIKESRWWGKETGIIFHDLAETFLEKPVSSPKNMGDFVIDAWWWCLSGPKAFCQAYRNWDMKMMKWRKPWGMILEACAAQLSWLAQDNRAGLAARKPPGVLPFQGGEDAASGLKLVKSHCVFFLRKNVFFFLASFSWGLGSTKQMDVWWWPFERVLWDSVPWFSTGKTWAFFISFMS